MIRVGIGVGRWGGWGIGGIRVGSGGVEGDAGGAGLGEGLDPAQGVVDHEVAVEEGGGEALAQRLHHGGAERDVGHEMAVHDVHVQPVRAHVQHPLALCPELREIGTQD